MLDAYNLRARAAPAALAALPALTLAGSSLTAIDEAGSVLAFALSAALVLLCGLVRNAGLRLQPRLWEQWDGAPTTRLLRWRGNDSSEIALRHRRLEELTGRALPKEPDETADLKGADRDYAAAVADLRDLTRDSVAFSLIAQENAEYGFRRNCLGIRPVALVLAATVLIASLVLAAGHSWELRYTIPGAVAGIALFVWFFLIHTAWVKQAADLYANRLLEALVRLTRGGA